jgi:hypothetical protein
MAKWYAHKDEIFNLDSFKIICKGTDCGDYEEDIHQILLSTDECNTGHWEMDEHSALSYDTEKERDKAFEDIKELLTQ